jgi:integrase
MARGRHRLTDLQVQRLKKAGLHADGGGLNLLVGQGGRARSWVFRSFADGRERRKGLGSYPQVSLSEARRLAQACRERQAAGEDPTTEATEEEDETPTFAAFAETLIASLETGWRHPKHPAQWRMMLTTYAAPLRAKRVDEISTADVLAVLNHKQLWTSKPATASRLRGRIERVLAAARSKGHIASPWENPARWRGHLDNLLPKVQRLSRGHHAALPFEDVPAFLIDLRARSSMAARALEFTILTAVRTSEALGARWDEIDLVGAVWTVPRERMKGGKLQHRVPLSRPVLALLTKLRRDGGDSPFVFPGQPRSKPLSNTALQLQLKRMRLTTQATPHGFRSSLTDWAGDDTRFPREVAAAALAHVVGDETEQAYRHRDALEKRRQLMEVWGAFCAQPATGQVIALRR